MLKERVGDLMALQEGILVHGCNCQGKMGAGFALSVKLQWPDVYASYMELNAQGRLRLGATQVTCSSRYRGPEALYEWVDSSSSQLPPSLVVVNAMTQFWYGREKGVKYLSEPALFAVFARVRGLALASGLPVHFPPIGSVLAGGAWETNQKIIESALGADVQAFVWRKP